MTAISTNYCQTEWKKLIRDGAILTSVALAVITTLTILWATPINPPYPFDNSWGRVYVYGMLMLFPCAPVVLGVAKLVEALKTPKTLRNTLTKPFNYTLPKAINVALAGFLPVKDCYSLSLTCREYKPVFSIMRQNDWYIRIFGPNERNVQQSHRPVIFRKDQSLRGKPCMQNIVSVLSRFLNRSECYQLLLTCKPLATPLTLMQDQGKSIIFFKEMANVYKEEINRRKARMQLVDAAIKSRTDFFKTSLTLKHFSVQLSRESEFFHWLNDTREHITDPGLHTLRKCMRGQKDDFFPFMLDQAGKIRPGMISTGQDSRFFECILEGRAKELQFLLDFGGDPNQLFVLANGSQVSPLEIAITASEEPYQLGKRWICYNSRQVSYIYATPGDRITDQSRVDMVRTLLSCPDIQFDVPSKMDNYTPLALAVLRHDTSIMQLLITKGADMYKIPTDMRFQYIKKALSEPGFDDQLVEKLMHKSQEDQSLLEELFTDEGMILLTNAKQNGYSQSHRSLASDETIKAICGKMCT